MKVDQVYNEEQIGDEDESLHSLASNVLNLSFLCPHRNQHISRLLTGGLEKFPAPDVDVDININIANAM